MRLVLHIGTPKTGSTFLQRACSANAGWLAQRGVLWPDLMCGPNHLTLFFAVMQGLHPFARDFGIGTRDQLPAFRDRLVRQIRRQTRRRGFHTMLASTEMLANLARPGQVRQLQALLAPLFPDGIRVVVYLRRQDEAMLSLWGENLRRGFWGPTWEEFRDRILTDPAAQPYLAYDRMLKRWAEAFGPEAIVARLHDRSRFRGGDLLSDFMAAVLGGDADLGEIERPPETNTGLSAPALEFLRRLHPFLPLYRDGRMNMAREALRGRIDELPVLPRPRLSIEDARAILGHYGPSNRHLAETWFPDLPRPLFPPPRRQDPTGNLGQISLDDFARFTGRLFT